MSQLLRRARKASVFDSQSKLAFLYGRVFNMSSQTDFYFMRKTQRKLVPGRSLEMRSYLTLNFYNYKLDVLLNYGFF